MPQSEEERYRKSCQNCGGTDFEYFFWNLRPNDEPQTTCAACKQCGRIFRYILPK